MTEAQPGNAEPVVDLLAFVRVLRRRWRFIAVAAVAGAVLALVVLNFTVPKYAASLRISPASTGSGGLGGALGQLGGLAAIAGVDVRQSSSAASPFDLYLDTLHARQTADLLARDPAIMHHIFERQWNPATRRWQPAASLTRPIMAAISSLAGQPRIEWRPPDGADLAEFIAKKLAIQAPKPKDPPVTTLYLEDPDPAFAARFLDRINAIADETVRARSLQRATEYARYLEGRLKTTTNGEQLKRLADILLEQDRAIMAASSSVSFAANVSEPAVATPRPVSPSVGARPSSLACLAARWWRSASCSSALSPAAARADKRRTRLTCTAMTA